MNDASRPVRPAGLSQADAAARLAAEGPNELPGGGRRSMLHVIADVLREPMLLLLIGAGVIYLVLGELYDALILMAFAGLSIVIAIVQEARTERAIDALRDLSLPHATVVRDGERSRIPSREVVRGDLLAVSEGSRIAADGWIFEAEGLHADEAILTGESVTVTKRALAGEPGNSPPLPGGNDLPYAYSGTLAVRGTGLVLVDATGPHSRIGQIGQSLASLETETPRLTLQTRRLVRWLAAFGLVVSVLAVLLYGFLRGGWLEAMLSGIAIAMSMLPEELPIVLTLFMTMGAFRMSRARVLARRGTAIETLGAATVLCTDKTGTLTENRMEIADLWLPDGQVFQPGSEDALLSDDHVGLARTGLLACLEEPFDPMEKAFHDLAATLDGARANYTLEKQYPITPDLLAMTHVWSQEDGSELIVAAKGAPETIADLCKLEAVQREDMEDSIAQMASHGLRVLAVASARWSGAELPDAQDGFAFEYRGLVGLADPLRQSVPGAVAELQEAGIRVVMITGDYPATAAAIAKQAGIATGRVMTGEEIARTDDDDLARHIAEVSVFARVMPEQKLRIVRALKAAGEVVAMTGDGVNDAPSLKAAHIGIAMGQRGTDVAREASSIVLLDDDFGSIVSAVRLGRRIYDNLRKATGFILAVHLPIGGLAIAPLLSGWPLILGPVHIALLEMVIDPVCSLAFEAEPEESDVMTRPPRAPDSPLISRSLLEWSLIQGGLALLALLGLAFWASQPGTNAEVFRATCFAGLILAVVVLIFANRSFKSGDLGLHHKHNIPMAIILTLVGTILAAIFLLPSVAGLLHFAVLGTSGIAAVASLAIVLGIVLAIAKRHFRSALTR